MKYSCTRSSCSDAAASVAAAGVVAVDEQQADKRSKWFQKQIAVAPFGIILGTNRRLHQCIERAFDREELVFVADVND